LSIADAVEDLYVAHWGNPSRRAHFEEEQFAIDVLKWDEATTAEGVTLYATVGSSTSIAEPAGGHLVEFVLGLLPSRDEVATSLAGLGLYAAHNETTLDHGHTVPADGPLWPGTMIHTFLVARPLPDFLPPLVLPERVHVEFLQAIPIFDSERAYKSERGTEALLSLWESQQVRFWDPDRAPVP